MILPFRASLVKLLKARLKFASIETLFAPSSLVLSPLILIVSAPIFILPFSPEPEAVNVLSLISTFVLVCCPSPLVALMLILPSLVVKLALAMEITLFEMKSIF